MLLPIRYYPRIRRRAPLSPLLAGLSQCGPLELEPRAVAAGRGRWARLCRRPLSTGTLRCAGRAAPAVKAHASPPRLGSESGRTPLQGVAYLHSTVTVAWQLGELGRRRPPGPTRTRRRRRRRTRSRTLSARPSGSVEPRFEFTVGSRSWVPITVCRLGRWRPGILMDFRLKFKLVEIPG